MDACSRQLALALVVGLAMTVCAAADPADDQYKVAAGHYVRQQWEHAASEFERLVEDYPDHPQAESGRFFLGEALVQLDRLADAEAHFREFLRRSPEHRYARQALFRAGETNYLRGRKSEARPDLARFAELHPDDKLCAYVLAYLGDIALAENEHAEAETWFRRAIKEHPQGRLIDDCRLGLGKALEQQGELEAAIAVFRELAQKSGSPLADEAHFHWAAALYEQGKYEEARSAFHALETRLPQGSLRDRARLGSGWAAFRLKRHDEAEKLLKSLLDRPEVGWEARFWLGMTYKATQRWDFAATELVTVAEATECSDEIIELARFHGGDALLQAGRHGEAIGQFERLLASEATGPWHDDALLGKLQAELALGDYAAAERTAEQFNEQFPDSELAAAVRRGLAHALVAQKKFDQALELLQGLHEDGEDLGSDDVDPPAAAQDRYLLALAQQGAERYDDALKTLQPLLDTAEGELRHDVQRLHGTILIGLNRYGEAIEPLRGYLAARPQAPDAAACRARLAICMARTGDLPSARAAFEQVRLAAVDEAFLVTATQQLAEAAYAAGDYQWSAELFRSIKAHGDAAGSAAASLAGEGWSLLRAGRFEEAAAAMDRLLTEFPDHPLAPEAAFARGRALEELGRQEAALATYRRVIEAFGPNDHLADALLAAARLHDQLDQDEEAALLYRRFVDEYEDDSRLDAALYQWAWIMRELDRDEQADELFTRLRQQHPDSALWGDATYRLAERALAAHDHQAARRLLDELVAAEVEPQILHHGLYLLGQVAAAERRWDDVAGPLERLIREAPETELRPLAEYWIAESTYRRDDFETAGELFDLLSEKTTGRKEPWVAMIALRRAQVRMHREDWTEALDIARGIARQFPDFSQQYEAAYVVGRCLAAKAQFEEAREAYREVIRSPQGGKTETAAMAQWMIGESHFHQRDYEAALREYLRLEILYAYPTWQAAALLQAGKCYEQQGRWQQATELYARLLKEFPDTSFTDEASRRLRLVQGRGKRESS